jgi:hypothetical protein
MMCSSFINLEYMKYGGLGQWECEVLMHQDSDYEKMHLYEVEKKQRTPL